MKCNILKLACLASLTATLVLSSSCQNFDDVPMNTGFTEPSENLIIEEGTAFVFDKNAPRAVAIPVPGETAPISMEEKFAIDTIPGFLWWAHHSYLAPENDNELVYIDLNLPPKLVSLVFDAFKAQAVANNVKDEKVLLWPSDGKVKPGYIKIAATLEKISDYSFQLKTVKFSDSKKLGELNFLVQSVDQGRTWRYKVY
ncbi:hypothetical protein B7R76_01875 [Mageeibacillus indolicus]|uniref:Lipoprotein n=1 Tax=Mageeibacillus indolicus TaxID=884684 RepID=A0A2J8B4I8_9FIRM|nr:hypothetical protein [Mageeibacillus indolicus]PNH19656.1 hypothetical protein B7R76_01875 [Mageeibacillus indolicus]